MIGTVVIVLLIIYNGLYLTEFVWESVLSKIFEQWKKKKQTKIT